MMAIVGSAARGLGAGVMAPAGLWLLVPGYSQWSSGQRERGLVMLGSCASAVAAGVFTWGTVTGLVMLAFAFLTHVASASDAVRRSAFPGPGRWATFLGIGLGLGVSVYGPSLALASVVAWPGMRDGASPSGVEGYLVNRWAYRFEGPRPGDWVWYRPDPWCGPEVGRVVAGRGQDVEWSGNRLRVDGLSRSNVPPLRSDPPPRLVSYRVPEGHVLIKPGGGVSPRRSSGALVIVSSAQVVGRAWARMYPVRGRRLLE